MEEVLFAIARQVPALALMVYLTLSFMRHLENRDRLLRDIAEESNEIHRINTSAMIENTRMLGRMEQTLDEIAKTRRADDRPPVGS